MRGSRRPSASGLCCPLEQGKGILSPFRAGNGLSRTDETIWTDLTKWLGTLRLAARREASAPGPEALLAAMVATSSDAIITIDAAGIIQSFNPAAERLFGYAESEVMGRNVKMLMPPHFRAEHDGYLARYQETGERRIIGIGRVVAGERKDGSTFPLELAVGEARIEGVPVFVGFIRDLTEIQTEQRRVQELQHEPTVVESGLRQTRKAARLSPSPCRSTSPRRQAMPDRLALARMERGQ